MRDTPKADADCDDPRRDHPAFTDPAYRRRRDAIAAQAEDHQVGQAIPRVEYSETEHLVWREVWQVLRPLHLQYACQEVIALQDRMRLFDGPIPQLLDLSRQLEQASGLCLVPVTGLQDTREFFSILRRGAFPSTQYIRHPSTPLYTPEPDLIHEFVGHIATLVDPRVAKLCMAFGDASRGANATEEVRLERVFWYSLEYGMVLQDGEPKAFGAGLLSSCDEIAQALTGPDHLQWDIDAMAEKIYDPTHMQPELFVADSVDHLIESLDDWLSQA